MTRRPGRRHRPNPHRTAALRGRRRRLAVAATVLGLVAFGVAARVLLFDVDLLDARQVRVTGAVTLTEQEVRAAAAVPLGVPLARVDTAAVAERVRTLPDVAEVTVKRRWPHTVAVDVTERVPVAVASSPQGDVLVDATGVPYRLAAPGTRLPQLRLDAVAPHDPATVAAVGVITGLPENLRRQVVSVEVTPGTMPQVVLTLEGERRVRWGTPEQTAEKAAVLAALLSQPGRVYDVASPELPTIRP